MCCCGSTATPHLLKRSLSRRWAVRARRPARSSPTTISHTSRRSSGACQQPSHVRSGLHRANGVTTKPIERSHVPTRDRLRASRGLKTLHTGQRFLEGFECLRALRGGLIRLADLLPAFSASASVQEHVRTVAATVLVLGMRLNKTPRTRRR
jgi:hypothetical protein